jgi:anti-anti-sigma factor
MTEAMNDGALGITTAADGTIVVEGDIDMAGGPLLEAAILERESDDPVQIDLAGVSFIDSSGLRSLLGASRRATARGTVVRLSRVGPEVQRLLEITGTTGQFEIVSSRD